MGEIASQNEHVHRFLEHARALSSYIRRYVRDAEDAAEVFQEVSLLVLRHPTPLPLADSFEAWCRGVARHVVSRLFRTRRRQASLLSRAQPEGHTLLAEGPVDPEHALASREQLSHVFAHIDEAARGLMVERYLLGHSAAEIAEQGAESASAVRMRLMRLRSVVQRARPPTDSWPQEGD